MELEFLIPIFFFAGVATIFWKYFDTRHRERMAVIEKGLLKEDLKYLYTSVWKTNPYSSLKWGMLAAFIGIGIIVSAFISEFFYTNEELVPAGIIFLFGGLGLISFYLITKGKLEKEIESV